jgi:hypothetical protein
MEDGISPVHVARTLRRTAFLGCSQLTTATLGEGLKASQSYAFFRCTLLRSIVIPNAVKTIND